MAQKNSDRARHRGYPHDQGAFAAAFVSARLKGFSRDIDICLTPTHLAALDGKASCAYFPALMSCCGMLEYLAMLYLGMRRRSLGHQEIYNFCATHLPETYSAELIRLLYEAFRNSIAHRGISSGIWIDVPSKRRFTYRLSESGAEPSLTLVDEPGELLSDSPWPTPYTHRFGVNIRRLAIDIEQGGTAYADLVASSDDAQKKFFVCMNSMYPR